MCKKPPGEKESGDPDSISCGSIDTPLPAGLERSPSRWRRRLRYIVAAILAVPIFIVFSLFYRGSVMLLEYRKFFGSRAPITLSPTHGVVSAFVSSSTENTASCTSEIFDNDLDYHFKTYSSNSTFDSTQNPLRILIVGDSTARGVGIQDSCHPVMPEVLATVLSRHFNGRPVYWSAVGEPGATIKMIAEQIQQTRNAPAEVSMNEFHALHRTPTVDPNDRESEVAANVCKAHEDRYTPDQLQWIKKLEYHEHMYKSNPFSGYDYVVALSGMNEVKRILIPFLIEKSDGFGITSSEDGGNASAALTADRGFKADLKALIQKLKDVSNDLYRNDRCSSGEDEEDCTPKTTTTTPHIIFPGMPVKHAPVRAGFLLRWILTKSCQILDNLKQLVEDEDPEHVFAAPIVSDEDTLDFIQKKGILADAINAKEDVKLRLVHVNGKVCRNLMDEMTTFYSQNRASVEPGKKMLELFSPDAVHPNDLGYDYFGRYLGLMIIEKWLTNHDEK
eukprot:scaffold1637_cov108-Cylindrotheca_fusiformis.AAC.2